MTPPLVYVRDLGGGHRIAIEVPGDGAQLTRAQFAEMIALLRGTADGLEQAFARGEAETAERGPAL